eukprot:scpid17777/ scgid32413/ 
MHNVAVRVHVQYNLITVTDATHADATHADADGCTESLAKRQPDDHRMSTAVLTRLTGVSWLHIWRVRALLAIQYNDKAEDMILFVLTVAHSAELHCLSNFSLCSPFHLA